MDISPEFLGQTALGLGDFALNAMTGPLALPLLGVKAAGDKMYGLNKAGKGAGESLARGALSGAVEALTEKLLLEQLGGLAKSGAANWAKSVLKQAGVEATEEAVSYLANWAADTLFNEGRFSAKELGQSAVGGAISGGALGAGAALIGRVNNPVSKARQTQQGKTATEPVQAAQKAMQTDNMDVLMDSSIRNEPSYITLKNKMRQELDAIKGYPPVSQLTGGEFPQGSGKLTEQVGVFFNSLGNKVHRAGFGDIVLDQQGIRDSISHGISGPKIAAFKAVPDVIKHGMQIEYQTNWKNRGYNTYTFAAPVRIGEDMYYVGAIVTKQNDGRFYLHEIISEDGGNVKSDTIKRNRIVQDGFVATDDSSRDSVALNQTLPQDATNVNTQSITTRQAKSEGLSPDVAQQMFSRGENILEEAHSQSSLDSLADLYGAIEQGEEPRARDARVPAMVAPDKPVTHFAQTLLEAGVTPDSMVENIKGMVLHGELSYQTVTDADAEGRARVRFEAGGASWDSLMREWHSKADSGKALNKYDIAFGQLLYNAAVNAVTEGNYSLASDVYSLISYLSTVPRSRGRT